MGAWGVKPFENDSASDFLYEFENNSFEEILKNAFELEDEDYIEVDEGSVIVAASEILAKIIKNKENELPDNLKIDKNINIKELSKKAKNSLEIVISENSELNELWQESDEYEKWVETINSNIEILKTMTNK